MAGEYHRYKKEEGLTLQDRPIWAQQGRVGGNFLFYTKNNTWLVGSNYCDAKGIVRTSRQGLGWVESGGMLKIPKSDWEYYDGSKWILDQELKIEGAETS